MNVFIWNEVSALTDNYHNGGGLVIVAESLEQARLMIEASSTIPGGCSALTIDPDAAYPLKRKEKPAVFIFEDAGCC